MVVLMHQKDLDDRLPLFLLIYRASTHHPSTNMVSGRELYLPCNPLFGTSKTTRGTQGTHD
jgi:hypothetical protein